MSIASDSLAAVGRANFGPVGIARLTIDQLAQRVGMTARNIRAHQSRGLLPPPSLEGRTGYYGQRHIDRLELILKLQDSGMNLTTIEKVLNGADHAVRDAMMQPFMEAEPQTRARSEVEGEVGVLSDAQIRVAEKAGLIRILDEELVEILQPAVIARSAELTAIGVPIEAQLEVVKTVHRSVKRIAHAFIELFERELLTRVAPEGEALDADAVGAGVEMLQLLATDVLLSMFNRAMTDAISEEFERLSKD